MSEDSDNYKVSDFNYITSAIGNAYFSGIGFSLLWEAVSNSKTREQLDKNVSAAIKAKEDLGKLNNQHHFHG